MKPSTNQCLGHERLTSAHSAAPATATVPAGTSAVYVSVETTSCRMTLNNGGDPTSALGLVLQKDQMPWFMPIGQGCVFAFASTDATPSVIQLSYLS